MPRRHFLLAVAILLCLPVLSDSFRFVSGVDRAASALQAHARFGEMVRQYAGEIEHAAGFGAGFGEIDHDADAGAGFEVLRWTVGGELIRSLRAIVIGLLGSEQEPSPAVRPPLLSPEITHPELYLAFVFVSIAVNCIFFRAALRQ